MAQKPIILDASALLALIFNEEGKETVKQALDHGVHMTTVNLAEVATKLLREQHTFEEVQTFLPLMKITLVEVDETLAYQAASYDPYTKQFGLSLEDRICLAAAGRWGYTALSADRAWKHVKLDQVSITLIR